MFIVNNYVNNSQNMEFRLSGYVCSINKFLSDHSLIWLQSIRLRIISLNIFRYMTGINYEFIIFQSYNELFSKNAHRYKKSRCSIFFSFMLDQYVKYFSWNWNIWHSYQCHFRIFSFFFASYYAVLFIMWAI